MSFLLQGNARSLSFHGEANAPSPSPGSLPGALGKPRVRKPSVAPRASIPQPTTRMTDAPFPVQAPAIRTPFPHRIPTPIPGLHEARSPYVARTPFEETFSDQDPTMALDRDADVMPGARMPARPLPAAGRPIPHFRGAAPAPLPCTPSVVVHDTAPARVTSRPGAAWLGWLAASLVLGLASYHVSPTVLAKVAPPAVASHAR